MVMGGGQEELPFLGYKGGRIDAIIVKGGKRCSARGWGKMAPKRGSQRDKMARRCGKKCFAGSLKARSYPICRKRTCRVEDKGLCAALYYAQLLGHKRLTRKLKKAIAGRAKGTRKRGGRCGLLGTARQLYSPRYTSGK